MFEEDLDVFFDREGFATTATFPLPDGSTFGFLIIFDDSFMNPETGLISLETTDPQASCKSSDTAALRAVLAAVNGSTPILDNQTSPLRSLPCTLEAAPGKNFAILQVRPEGTGTDVIVFSHEP